MFSATNCQDEHMELEEDLPNTFCVFLFLRNTISFCDAAQVFPLLDRTRFFKFFSQALRVDFKPDHE